MQQVQLPQEFRSRSFGQRAVGAVVRRCRHLTRAWRPAGQHAPARALAALTTATETYLESAVASAQDRLLGPVATALLEFGQRELVCPLLERLYLAEPVSGRGPATTSPPANKASTPWPHTSYERLLALTAAATSFPTYQPHAHRELDQLHAVAREMLLRLRNRDEALCRHEILLLAATLHRAANHSPWHPTQLAVYKTAGELTRLACRRWTPQGACAGLPEVATRLHALAELAEYEPLLAELGQQLAHCHWPRLLTADSATLATAVDAGCRLNLPVLAERGLRRLRLRQMNCGLLAFEHPIRQSNPVASWRELRGTAAYLSAAARQVHTAFMTSGGTLPVAIDPSDGRLQTVLDWVHTLPAGSRVADVGCGPGRYLRHLQQRRPDLALWGLDPQPALLAQLPEGIQRQAGSILALPLVDNTFDAALAIEVVEHALVPRQAIRELCRIVRPGGSVLVIDKRAEHQALSLHESWEQWPAHRELAAWLAEDCDAVSVSPLAHADPIHGQGLFMAWQATVRETGNMSATRRQAA